MPTKSITSPGIPARLYFVGLLLCLLLARPHQTYGQKNEGHAITYSCENEKLSKALSEIERRSGYYRMQFLSEDVAPYRVTVSLDKAPVNTAVTEVLKATPLRYDINGRYVSIYKPEGKRTASAIRGRVVDENGEPVIGATVTPDGGATPVATDVDGNFSIPSNGNVTGVTVTYVGLKPAYAKVSGSPMNIVMNENSNALNEVMVVAFGTAKKASFTGSAAVLNSKELSQHITTNVASALAGSVPGLQLRGGSGAPGSGAGDINIRGIGSLYASTSPLIIVDGAPYKENLSNIPQSDIESISVLKDAASAALYGARGATGVIIITTKKGAKDSTRISVDAKWGASTRAIQEYDIIKDPATYYEAYYSQIHNFYTSTGIAADQAHVMSNEQLLKDLAYNVYDVPAGSYLIGTDGRINPSAKLGRKFTNNGTEYYLTPDDWTESAYRSGFRQEYNVSVNGGSDKASYYTSINYLDEDGVIDYSGYERVSARVKADFQAKPWLKLGANINFAHSRTSSTPSLSNSATGSNIMYFTSMMAPIYPIYVRQIDQNGNVMISTDEYGHEAYDYGTPNAGYGISRPFGQSSNPLGSNRYDKNDRTSNILSGILTADANITSFLKLNVTSALTWSQLDSSIYANPFYGNNVATKGSQSKNSGSYTSTNNTQTLTFFKGFGNHYVNVMLGHEYYRTDSKNLTASAYGGFSPSVPELSAFATPSQVGSSTSRYNVEGWFANTQYNLQERYFFSASFRRDASSRFLKKNRWGDFWSVGGAWLLNREKFLNNITFIDILKAKISIGQQGNDNIASYAYADMYNLIPSSDGMAMIPTFSRMGNPNITWETTTNFNAGIEWGLFGNRFSGSFDFYTKKTTDLLFYLTVPRSTGAGGYYDNIGDIRNTGVELTLNGSILRTRDYEWNVSFNIAHNSAKLLKLPASKMGNRGGFYSDNNWYAENSPMYNYMCVAYAGVNENGQALYYQDTDLLAENGSMDTSRPGTKRDATTTIASQASRYTMGSTLPKAYGGFSTSARIKWFDISLTFDYQLGGKVFDQRYQTLMTPTASTQQAGRNFHKDIFNAWSPTNTSSDIPHWQYLDENAASACDRFLTSARYLNFQSFTVGFSMPSEWIKNYAKVRVYLSGENLCFWSARKGLDPRYSYSGNTSVPTYSPVRTIMGGLQVSF